MHRRIFGAAACISFALLAGCKSHESAATADPPPRAATVSTERELYQHFDGEVIVAGTAVSSETEGVAVEITDGTHIVIPELKFWPASVLNQRVIASGVLRRIAAPAGQRPKPEDRFALTAVRWKSAKPATAPAR